MKVYVHADMEGISGIRSMVQVQFDSPEYAEGRRLMMADMNVAIDAAFVAGATEVIACDTHGGGGQIDVREMDPRAVYELPASGRMMPSLDESFTAVVELGRHARAGTLNGFLDHTMSSKSWFEYKLNGQPMGELGIVAAYAGHYDVPVVAVSGDAAAAKEAADLLDGVECAVVKWGLGRNKARCLSIENAHAEIRRAVEQGIRNAANVQPFKPSLPATIELTFCRSDMADAVMHIRGLERIDARTVRRQSNSLLDLRL